MDNSSVKRETQDVPSSIPLQYAPPGRRRIPIRIIFHSAVVVLALLASAIWAFLDRPIVVWRAQNNLAKSAMNLQQIGVAMRRYAGVHNHEFPDSMLTILANEAIDPAAFVNPSSSDWRADGPTTQAMLADFAQPGHCSYLYFGAGLTDRDDPTTVTACDAPMQPPAPGLMVLFLDGHAEYFSGVTAQQIRAALAVGRVTWSAAGWRTTPTTTP